MLCRPVPSCIESDRIGPLRVIRCWVWPSRTQLGSIGSGWDGLGPAGAMLCCANTGQEQAGATKKSLPKSSYRKVHTKKFPSKSSHRQVFTKKLLPRKAPTQKFSLKSSQQKVPNRRCLQKSSYRIVYTQKFLPNSSYQKTLRHKIPT